MLRVLGLLVLFSASSAVAQSGRSVPGEPERSLAGINFTQTGTADIEKMYGAHSAMIAVTEEPYPAGTKLYKWGRLTVTLKVLTEPEAGHDVIRDIEVRGEGEPGNQLINRTGRGLKLGAKTSEIKKIYGIDGVSGANTLQWPDGTTLVIDVSEAGRVSRLELRAPNSDRAH